MHTTARWQGYWSFPHTTKRSEYLFSSTKLDIQVISCFKLWLSYLRLDAVSKTSLRGRTCGLLSGFRLFDLTLLGAFEGFTGMGAHFVELSEGEGIQRYLSESKWYFRRMAAGCLFVGLLPTPYSYGVLRNYGIPIAGNEQNSSSPVKCQSGDPRFISAYGRRCSM